MAAEHDVAEGASVRLSGAVADSVPVTATPRGATQEDDFELSGLSDGALVFEAGVGDGRLPQPGQRGERRR